MLSEMMSTDQSLILVHEEDIFVQKRHKFSENEHRLILFRYECVHLSEAVS